MSLSLLRNLGAVVVTVVALAASAPAIAQTACITPDCAFGGTPAQCANRAAPRTPTVNMGKGASLVFDPANPKIEPGDCITWLATTLTHSSSGNSCTDDNLCGSPAPPACEWDTANVASGTTSPASTCYYNPARFPAASADPYYCRIHASPTVGTMRGTLRVTTPINILVAKNIGTNSVVITWTGGGVTGDVSYKVERQDDGDPTFASTLTLNPDGGVLGTTFTDTGDLGDPTTHYYLVRNKQTNEP